MVKKKLSFFTLFAIALIGTLLFSSHGNELPQRRKTYKVEFGTVKSCILTDGSVEPLTHLKAGTQVSGRLKKIAVRVGQTVKKGDLIAEIDPRPLNKNMVVNTNLYLERLESERMQLLTNLASKKGTWIRQSYLNSVPDRLFPH